MAGVDKDAWVARVLGVALAAANAAQDGTGAGALSVMRLGKARVEWIGVRRQAQAELKRLAEALVTEFGADADQRPQLINAVKMLQDRINRLDPTLETELDKVLNAEGAARPKLAQAAQATLDGFTGFLATDAVMTKLDGNEVLPDMTVIATLTTALGNIRTALGEAQAVAS